VIRNARRSDRLVNWDALLQILEPLENNLNLPRKSKLRLARCDAPKEMPVWQKCQGNVKPLLGQMVGMSPCRRLLPQSLVSHWLARRRIPKRI